MSSKHRRRCCAALIPSCSFRYYRTRPSASLSASLPLQNVPHVTIIRPIKGLEPKLYECLASTFQQKYPTSRLTIFLCVSSRQDPAVPILERLIENHPTFDATILFESEDPCLQGRAGASLGPNPKIRNMSRAYREAKGDLVWIIDCNIWVGKGVAGRMVDTLCGFSSTGPRQKQKFVHQLPLVIDVTTQLDSNRIGLLDSGRFLDHEQVASTSPTAVSKIPVEQAMDRHSPSTIFNLGGGRLEELFLSSSHAKFYTAINTVLLAPCIVGKSNMFRRSHLDTLTSAASHGNQVGIDYFSHNICEDHLIGDMLWRQPLPSESTSGSAHEQFGKHAMVFGDLAIQPMANMSVTEYAARRVRWLRVRKFTVTLATLVEPGTECFLCSLYGAFAITTLPWLHDTLNFPQTWAAFMTFWFVSVTIWAVADRALYKMLHAMSSVEADENTPAFARRKDGDGQRSLSAWFLAWLGREALAWPIWAWAVFGGVMVVWRGQKFEVGMDMRVHALPGSAGMGTEADARDRKAAQRH